MEDRTAGVYDAAVNRFKNGWINAEALARVIDSTIMPELLTARAHLKALGKVRRNSSRSSPTPKRTSSCATRAGGCVRTRSTSWNLGALREADKAERASLEAFEKIRPGAQDTMADGGSDGRWQMADGRWQGSCGTA